MIPAAHKRNQARVALYELLNAAEDKLHQGDEGIDVKSLAALLLVSCLVNSRDKMRRIFRRRQGAMTSSGGHHARKSNAADGEKDQQIMVRINQTGH